MRPTSFEQDVNPFYSMFRAKGRPSKKARVTNPPEDPVAEEEEPRGEPEQTGEPEGLHPETTFDDLPLDGNILTNQQMLNPPPLILNRQNQTGLIQ